MEFPSWHIMEESDGYFYGHLFTDLGQYESDISEEIIGAQIGIDDAIDACLRKEDAIIYEVDARSFDIIRILHA